MLEVKHQMLEPGSSPTFGARVRDSANGGFMVSGDVVEGEDKKSLPAGMDIMLEFFKIFALRKKASGHVRGVVEVIAVCPL